MSYTWSQLSLVAVGFNIFRTIKVDQLLSTLIERPDGYADFEFLGFWQVQYNNMVAVVVFFAWIKIFKYIRYDLRSPKTVIFCAKLIASKQNTLFLKLQPHYDSAAVHALALL